MARLADALRVAATGRAPTRVVRGEVVPARAAAALEVRDRPAAPVDVEVVGVRAQRDIAADEIGWRLRGGRPLGGTGVNVTQETALRSSAWWAGLQFLGNLESSLPIDVYMRSSTGDIVEMTAPEVLEQPYPGVDIGEHLQASRVDLKRYGNSVGIIRSWSALGLPMSIELAPMSEVSAIVRGTQVREWRICGETFDPAVVWHERENLVGGWPIGLSPLAYAAWTLSGYLSAQEFVTDWFMGGAAPSGTLKNTQLDELDDDVIEGAKARFKLATAGRDVFVTGADWEWIPAAMDAQSAGFLEQQAASAQDVARYLGIPGDMIDVPAQGSSITYANITQRNLQALIVNVGPGLRRRERYWSRRALPIRRYMRFNTRAFLRLDPQTQTQLLLSEVGAGMLTPTEYRALQERPAYTAEQLDELRTFGIIGGSTSPAAVPAGDGVPA